MTVSIGSGRVRSNFFTWVGLDWASQLMGWVGWGHTKWTHGQLWNGHCGTDIKPTSVIRETILQSSVRPRYIIGPHRYV